MTVDELALVVAVGLVGPLAAAPRALRLPVLVGELAAGVAFGATGLRVLHPQDPSFTLLANIGFALVMFVAGTHVPLRDSRLKRALRTGVTRSVAVGVAAAVVGWLVARAFGSGHAELYAVLLASSSAALVMPLVAELGIDGGEVLDLLAQVAVADTACIVALPLVIDPRHAARAALGAAIVAGAAFVAFLLLRALDRSGLRHRAHQLSEERSFALELRVILLVLFLLAALSARSHVSIMLAGFGLGLAVSAVGEPRRLARQLFALTEGFFGPLFFVWVGATLDLRAFGTHPKTALLGGALGAAAVAAHLTARLLGLRAAYAVLSAGQLGLPIAAVTIGTQRHLLSNGESAAILLAALVTIASATAAGRLVPLTTKLAAPTLPR